MSKDSSIELSRDGIKISYRRFLTDATPGFLIVLFLIWAHYTTHSSCLVKHFQHVISFHNISTEVKSLILVIFFLLALPMGVLMNAAGWLLLEWAQKKLETFFCNCEWCFSGFKKEYDFNICRQRLAFKKNHWYQICNKKNNWFEKVRTAEIALINDFPDKSDAIEAIRGIAILSRNLALMSFLAIFCLKETFLTVLFLGFLAIWFLLLSAVVSFYFHVQIARLTDVLCDHHEAKLLKKMFPSRTTI